MTRSIRCKQEWCFRALVGLCLRGAAALISICVVSNSPAFGQMGYTSVYSDTFGDDSAFNTNCAGPGSGSVVIGTGTSEESYNSYGHEHSVTVTIIGPNGDSMTTESGFGGSYASGSAIIGFDPDVEGDFFTSVEDRTFCPIANHEYFSGQAFSNAASGGGSCLFYQRESAVPLTTNLCGYTICASSEDDTCATFLRSTAFHPV
jgi:hypothetical protein